MECKNGTVVNGNIVMGLAKINSSPPTINNIEYVAMTGDTPQAGVSTTQKINTIGSNVLLGGSIVVPFIWVSGATASFRTLIGANVNRFKTKAYNPPLFPIDNIAWGASTAQVWLQTYIRAVEVIP